MKTTLFIFFAAVVGVYGDASSCGTLNGQCGNNGKCETECVATGAEVGTTPCTSPCDAGKSCSWKCENVASTCSEVSDSCGNNGGTCATECVTAGDEQGDDPPTCSSPTCTDSSETCSWKCQTDADVCATVDQACGTNSKCVTECAASPGIPGAVAPTCNPTCSSSSESCSWKCQVRVGADLCATVNQTCGTSSKCVTECAASPGILGLTPPTCNPACAEDDENCSWKCLAEAPGSGTSRPALLLPLTILGTLLKMQCILE